MTIGDVASAAGVAPMTVSRVINSPERVAEATAERVRQAIARLGYVPNLLAGGLSSRRSRMIAAVVPTIAHPMFAALIDCFTAELRMAGYQVMLSLTGYTDDGAEEALVHALLGRRPDGILLTGAEHSRATRQMLIEAGIPVAEIFDWAVDPIDALVGFDHVAIGVAVADYFLERGHERFAMFAAGDRRAMARRRGFIEEVRVRGGTVVAAPILEAPSTIMAGREALRAMLELLRPEGRLAAPGPSSPRKRGGIALFCSSDLLAFGAIVEAGCHRIAVPGQLAVCGFGSFEIGLASEPPFTTVAVEASRIGRAAAEIILAQLAGATPPRRIEVPFRIVERSSS